ncbi:MAG: thiamine pyrophosphate-binding protein [Methanobacteriales archaeon]|nr:thiamine pyrophosphate-binding protein [Methanobacteriales archaeon]
MTTGARTKCAQGMVRILEEEGIELVFGHPGEQILPLYQALHHSPIQHVLMRHEQGAAHAADGYARATGRVGLCLAAAGPGALNLVMGVATAYKDSVPLLVITGDVSTEFKGQNTFQDVPQVQVFQPITLASYDIKTPEESILKLKEAFHLFKNGKTGPIHLNIPRDVLSGTVGQSILETEYAPTTSNRRDETSSPGWDEASQLLKTAQKPLILAGAGVLWSGAVEKLQEFAQDHKIPVATTYPARGVLPEDHHLSLGLIGMRGTEAANQAGARTDLVLAVGCRLSERTLKGLGEATIIHVNLDEAVLKGKINIKADAGEFLGKISHLKLKNTQKWLDELRGYRSYHAVPTDYDDIPLKPQRAINDILESSTGAMVVNDAGSHTTWVNLLGVVGEPSGLIFSGGFGPMGYGLPAAVGVSLGRPEKNVVLVVGDGGFQMTLQELAVISQLQLPILITLINNQGLGIIKQWQELYYDGPYQVGLENPDFVALAASYGIKGQKIKDPDQLSILVQKALRLKKPYLIEIVVDPDEGIPLPEV